MKNPDNLTVSNLHVISGLMPGLRSSVLSDPEAGPGGPNEEANLLAIAEALADLSQRVADEARRTAQTTPVPTAPPDPQPAGHSPGFTSIHGLPEINGAIKEKLEQARFEILTAQPDGPRPGPVLDDALDAVRRQLANGVQMRTLYQHSTRFDEATKQYVRAVSEYGVQVRTLPEFFDRIVIIDRSTVFIPSKSDRTSAIQVEEPAVVHFLIDVFERSWDRAETYPFLPVRAAEAAPEVIPAMRNCIRRMLIEGRSDKEIARRLGISLRSLQAHVARIKDDYNAQHRLQLGYLMGLDDRGPDSE